MIGSEEYRQLVVANPVNIKDKINLVLSPVVAFSSIANFPKKPGIYFIYDLQNIDDPVLLYIGSAYQGDRTIYIRCSQYLQSGKGGDALKVKLQRLLECNEAIAIEYIKKNYGARFIEMDCFEKQCIKQLEYVCIWAYQPPLNFILHKFDFQQLAIDIE